MRKFWTRVASFFVLVIIMISFTGCALFTDDLDKKYSDSSYVATVGEDIKISRWDLYRAYTSWGYQYVQSTDKESMITLYGQITEVLIDQEINKKLSIEKFGAITEMEQAIVRKQVYDSIDSVLKDYTNEILDIKDETTDSSEETSQVEYEEYNKTINATVSSTQQSFEMNLEAYAEGEDVTHFSSNPNDPAYAEYKVKYTPDIPGSATHSTALKAMTRIVRNLENREQGFDDLAESTEHLNLNNSLIKALTKDEQYALNREIDRMIEDAETSLLVSRLSTAFDLGITNQTGWHNYLTRGMDINAWEESILQSESGIATGIANDAMQIYKDRVQNAITDYELNPPLDMEADLISSIDGVYYVPEDIAKDLFTVSHVLVEFTDEQQAEYDAIIKKAELDPVSYDKDTALNELYAKVGNGDKNIYDIYNEITSDVNMQTSTQDKYNTFRDYIYKYNSDPGMQNPTFEYVMSVNKDKNGMVESFTDASIELKQDGEKGDVSGIVWSNYGAHIIMYTRDLSDFIWTADSSLLERDYYKTLFQTQTSYGNKSTFDVLVESLQRNYDAHEIALLTDYKKENTVTIYTNEIEDIV